MNKDAPIQVTRACGDITLCRLGVYLAAQLVHARDTVVAIRETGKHSIDSFAKAYPTVTGEAYSI